MTAVGAPLAMRRTFRWSDERLATIPAVLAAVAGIILWRSLAGHLYNTAY
jgi:hypothetical protein